MSKPLVEIMKLNQERYGTTFDFTKALEKLEEELQEFRDEHEEGNDKGMIDALADIIVIAAGEMVKLGYNPELCLKQTIKEIFSRQQDPVQATAWVNGQKVPGEKWLKNRQQDPSTIYKADYSTCKLPVSL